MGSRNRARGSELTAEQRARIEAIRTARRTPEARAREAAVREEYADRPGLDDLLREGKVDAERLTTMGALGSLVKATAAVRRAREARGVSLTEVSRRSGLPLPALSRLESGKNPRPTFETLARYAAGVGLEIDIVVRDGREAEPKPTSAEDKILAVRSADLDRLLATIHGQFDALRAAAQTTNPSASGPG